MKHLLGELASKKMLRAAGLMSGTSADGVDAAIVDVGRSGVSVLAFETFPYSRSVRRKVLSLAGRAETGRGGRDTVEDLCQLNFLLGEVFAEAVVAVAGGAGIALDAIDLIGSHGQTVCHLPRPRAYAGRRIRSTLQIGEPAVIAERTGITTVADFRPRDVAAGGEGAPLVPYVDRFLFSHPRLNRAVQNIGGIANVTFLPASGRPGRQSQGAMAFDTGPGNMVIDGVVAILSKGRRRYDADGRMAARGQVNAPLLAELMKHSYLRRRPPKSTGAELFGRQFAEGLCASARERAIAGQDLVATVTAFTAASIAAAYRRFLPKAVDEAILCGGGARNPALVAALRDELRPARVVPSDDLGIDADAKEAVSFAVLAAETVRGRAGNVPAATGATHPVVLGKILPGRRGS